MSKIVTLTINPAVDKSTKFAGLVAEQKIRCDIPHFDAGGGGINVSKAIKKLGGNSIAIFPKGGSTGDLLQDLLKKVDIDCVSIKSESWTRENFIAVDTNTNAQYRFGMPSEAISAKEMALLLEKVENEKPEFIIASGSLPENLPLIFFSNLAKIAKKSNAKLIVDTSGKALGDALKAGLYLVKPNIGELAKLIGVESLEISEAEGAARDLISKYKCEIVVVSLGPQGAMLVTESQKYFCNAPVVKKKSTVGAGDSMVGGMVWALSQNLPLLEVLKWGVACGSAATMNEGTQLFNREDAVRLFEGIY